MTIHQTLDPEELEILRWHMSDLDFRKVVTKQLSISQCEAQEIVPHTCRGDIRPRFILVKLPAFQAMPDKQRRKFVTEKNCSMLCEFAFRKVGNSEQYRRWFARRMQRIYGDDYIADVKRWNRLLAEFNMNVKTTGTGAPVQPELLGESRWKQEDENEENGLS